MLWSLPMCWRKLVSLACAHRFFQRIMSTEIAVTSLATNRSGCLLGTSLASTLLAWSLVFVAGLVVLLCSFSGCLCLFCCLFCSSLTQHTTNAKKERYERIA